MVGVGQRRLLGYRDLRDAGGRIRSPYPVSDSHFAKNLIGSRVDRKNPTKTGAMYQYESRNAIHKIAMKRVKALASPDHLCPNSKLRGTLSFFLGLI